MDIRVNTKHERAATREPALRLVDSTKTGSYLPSSNAHALAVYRQSRNSSILADKATRRSRRPANAAASQHGRHFNRPPQHFSSLSQWYSRAECVGRERRGHGNHRVGSRRHQPEQGSHVNYLGWLDGWTRPKLGGLWDAPGVHWGFEGCVSPGALPPPCVDHSNGFSIFAPFRVASPLEVV